MDAQGFIAAAVARSFRNMGQPAASSDELLGVLSRLFHGYYAEAADQNPSLFALRASVAWNVGGYWIAPSDQYALYEIQAPGGEEIVVVPFSDPRAEPSVGAVFRLGLNYYPAGNANDPSNVALTFTYQPVPPVFATLSAIPPTTWPAQFNERVICDLATYLAEKDGRADDIQAMQAEAGKWKRYYLTWLSMADSNTVRRFSVPQQVPTPQIIPVGVSG